jgi:hypothetical protein
MGRETSQLPSVWRGAYRAVASSHLRLQLTILCRSIDSVCGKAFQAMTRRTPGD